MRRISNCESIESVTSPRFMLSTFDDRVSLLSIKSVLLLPYVLFIHVSLSYLRYISTLFHSIFSYTDDGSSLSRNVY